ncbi:MAG TPA: helix-turn-helix transcriptional regulator, partial [Actinomycetota bacterium]|nr:helix-turn-helix transcriptional regulator [Actinomycetota bacterium]
AVAHNAAAAAKDAAGSSAHREAAAFARLALEHEALFDRLEVARLHGLTALALYARNQFGEAAQHADRAVELWDTAGSAPLELGEALLISARMSTLRADPAAARAKALRALGILEAHPPSRALALCYSTLCSQDTMQARFDTALGWCKRALEVAERVGSLDVVSHALGYRGLSKVSLGDDAGLADLERALEVADRLGHGDYVTVAAHNLAVILIRTGRVREAGQALEVGERAAREHALDTALFRIEAQQCHVLLIEGSWDEAERRLRRLLRRSEDPGANLVNPLAFLGRILARRGDPEAAGLIERAWRLASATGEDQKMAVAAGARIEHAWIDGDDDRVRAIGGELLELAVRAQHRYLRGEVLRYLRRVGEPVAPFDGCLAPFTDGITGDWAAAAAGWERIGNPYHQALELTEAPDLEVALRGLGMLDRLGAVATASLVRRRLRRGGARGIPRGPRAATRANPGQLTDRQLEVLALLAEGSTNAEIAARLYLSQRTVDNHVAALLARLGVSSRHDALAVAAGLGLLAPPERET